MLSITLNFCTVGYVCSFCGDQIIVDFVSFLSMIIYEVSYTLSWCLMHKIFSAWFLDIRLSSCFKACINIGLAYIKGVWKDVGVVWVVITAIIKNWNNTNGRAKIGYDVHMYSQWANILLQDLEICVLTVKEYQVDTAILELIPPFVILLGWQNALWKSRPVDHTL